MKTSTIVIGLLALLLGLLGGYLLFGTAGGSPAAVMDDSHNHGAEGATWTCSMHPQIQRPEPGDCPICGMDLIPLTSSAAANPTVLTMTEAALALARVSTTTVGRTPSTDAKITNGITLTGRLAADERTTSVETTEFGGRIERLLVSFAGERVRAGQQIATVYSPDLAVAQEELLQALSLDSTSALVAAARERLRNLELTEAQLAELERGGELLRNFPVYADADGTVLEMQAEVGQYLPAGGALYTYTDLSSLWALFDAYEEQLDDIAVGDRIRFTVNGRPDETYTARVTFIDPIIDPVTRTAAVRAEVDNRRGRLQAGAFVRGTLSSSADSKSSDKSITVPTSAVLWTGERSVVYVAVPDAEVPTYQFREIELGERSGDSYRVLSGLEAGEEVVTSGAFQLDAAAQLRNQVSMMNRDVRIQGRSPLSAGEGSGVRETTALVLPDYREEATPRFREQLTRVAGAYVALKDRMVASEVAGPEVLTPIRLALAEVDMSQVAGDAHLYWMEQLAALNDHLGAVAGAASLEKQRRQFRYFSQALINTLTVFGADETLYVQYCPMAFDGEGANWISAEAPIRNPYYGDAMLSCGSTVDTLSAK